MLIKTYFTFSYLSDVKSLPGFIKGGRDKVPKETNQYFNGLISGWSEPEIKNHIETVATKSKDILDISAREFKTPSYHIGTGGFSCQYFNYDFTVTQSEDDSSQCIFSGALEIPDIESLNEIQNVIDQCFEYAFEKVNYNLPEGNRDIKELIYNLDDNKKKLSTIFDFSYENDFSAFQLIHKNQKRIITVNSREVEIEFKEPESIPEMIKGLKELNSKIFLGTSFD